jgi:hypothetical protein
LPRSDWLLSKQKTGRSSPIGRFDLSDAMALFEGS